MSGGHGLSVVVTSHDRPALVRRAVRSVARQRQFREIVVVDDASETPVDLGGIGDPRIRLIRSEVNRGVSASRNRGLDHVTASHVMYLDDDDVYLPWAGWFALRWLASDIGGEAPRRIHVGSLSIGAPGRRITLRRPPSSRAGEIWGLDEHVLGRGESFATKQAAVIPVALLREAGGWDEALRSRVTSELFFRLTQIAEVVGHRVPVYHLNRGRHDRITADPERRLTSVAYIRRKHAALLADPARLRAFDSNHRQMMRVSSEAGALHLKDQT